VVMVRVIPGEQLPEGGKPADLAEKLRPLTSLAHPHIVPIRKIDTIDDGLYFAWDQMAGGSLADRLKSGPIPPPEAIKMLAQVGRALDFLHQHSLLHLDVRPQSILFDETGSAYLANFGLTRWIQGRKQVAQHGMVLGAVSHIAPETINGEPPSHYADIYALGVTVFQTLTGDLPFPASDPTNAIMAHMTKLVPNPTDYNMDLPPDLRPIITKAMAKAPLDRYKTAEALTSDLRKALREVLMPPEASESKDAPAAPEDKPGLGRLFKRRKRD
ncbi:MAG: serine/threonine protein kinase, partial [Chloroflexi bacterium]|nr:serine/threonine protein kinase [Chloroflexota bacterium]